MPAVLENFPPRGELWVGIDPHSALYAALLTEAAKLGVRVRHVHAGRPHRMGLGPRRRPSLPPSATATPTPRATTTPSSFGCNPARPPPCSKATPRRPSRRGHGRRRLRPRDAPQSRPPRQPHVVQPEFIHMAKPTDCRRQRRPRQPLRAPARARSSRASPPPAPTFTAPTSMRPDHLPARARRRRYRQCVARQPACVQCSREGEHGTHSRANRPRRRTRPKKTG